MTVNKEIDKWLSLVKEYYGLCGELNTHSKERTQFRARAVAMCLLSHKLNLTQKVIAEIFKIKNRCSVSYSIKRAMEIYVADIRQVEELELKKRQEEIFE